MDCPLDAYHGLHRAAIVEANEECRTIQGTQSGAQILRWFTACKQNPTKSGQNLTFAMKQIFITWISSSFEGQPHYKNIAPEANIEV